MWVKGLAANTLNRLNSLSRSRKIIALILVCLALLYLFSSSIPSIKRTIPTDETASLCIDDNLRFLSGESKKYDAFINHDPQRPDEKFYPAYIGNGKLAVSLNSQNGLYIRLNRALSLPIKYYPLVNVHADEYSSKDATVLNIHHGIAEKIQCFEVDKGWRSNCLMVESQVYASRTRPSLLVQDLKLTNPSKNSVVVNIDQAGEADWHNAKIKKATAKDSSGTTVDYTSSQSVIPTQNPQFQVHVAVATVKLDSIVTIKPGKTIRFHVVTVVNYTQPVSLKTPAPTDLLSGVEQQLETVLKIHYVSLREEHIKVWRNIWKSGFGISNSKASGALNGDKINSTIYYVLSNTQAPLHELASTADDKTKIMKTLHYPDRCYGGHTLLFYSETLWSEIKDETDIADVTSTWMITLEKKGCNIMVRAGAEGVLQAILLSLGGLRFDNNHLEMSMEPKDLHRDLLFHRLNYGNNTHVNISVIVGEDNKAVIRVSLDRNDRPYYACDAGCIDPPIALSKEVVQFPVKKTDPITSILYITSDKQHMEELKHTIHVKEIKEAPAHEHHIIALHKHGHHFGGLPTIFWVSIAFLILIFHMFLCKLIYNEYCQGQDRYGRTRYSI